jgi:hypothetical protein
MAYTHPVVTRPTRRLPTTLTRLTRPILTKYSPSAGQTAGIRSQWKHSPFRQSTESVALPAMVADAVLAMPPVIGCEHVVRRRSLARHAVALSVVCITKASASTQTPDLSSVVISQPSTARVVTNLSPLMLDQRAGSRQARRLRVRSLLYHPTSSHRRLVSCQQQEHSRFWKGRPARVALCIAAPALRQQRLLGLL